MNGSLRPRLSFRNIAYVIVLSAISLLRGAVPEQQQFGRLIAVRIGQDRLLWEVQPELIALMARHVPSLSSPDARLVGNVLLKSISESPKPAEDKKECCYKKIGENIWSCCNGTYVSTGAPQVKQLFSRAEPQRGQLANAASETGVNPEVATLLVALRKGNALKRIRQDDGRFDAVQWSRMKE